jgi:hypothetical protein
MEYLFDRFDLRRMSPDKDFEFSRSEIHRGIIKIETLFPEIKKLDPENLAIKEMELEIDSYDFTRV